MADAPIVSIIIPVFNQWSYTDACLGALTTTISKDISHEIIVVDNASTDSTEAGLNSWRSRLPNLRVERMSSNTGFSPACNRGAELSKGEYLVFLNNDTVPSPHWLSPLLSEFEQPNVGLVGPKLVSTDTFSVNHAGYVFGAGAFYGLYQDRPASLPGVNKKRDFQALLGACVMIPRQLFFELEMFSLDGLEDIDLCIKIRQSGKRVVYVPESVLIHHGSVTLKNSEPGSFPVTCTADFGTRWSTEDVIWDDYRYYLEDGEWPAPLPRDGKTPIEVAESSINTLIQAYMHFNSNEGDKALAKAQEALRLWPHNPMAYLLQCLLLLEAGRSQEAISELTCISEFSFYPGLLTHLLPAISAALPPEIVRKIALQT
jgi:GT2 family glycosyltransferase